MGEIVKMKINNITIRNFRGIKYAEAFGLGDTIIIAGQNGSGKSCVFDAIRLLKSVYGGYQQNEWQHFFGEFQIQLHGGAKNLKNLFNNSNENLVIRCTFQLRDNEKKFIAANAYELLEEATWQAILPEAFQGGSYQKALFSNAMRERQPEVTERVNAQLPELFDELVQKEVIGELVVDPKGNLTITPSTLLYVAFTNYRPKQIGVIDFHGAQRHYGRENVQGINLNLDQAAQQYSQHTLYNYNNKYNNVKSEMAGNYIRQILSERADSSSNVDKRPPALLDTMKELFESFFPDKKFHGPRPNADGSLSFPVTTQGGTEHDLDELSSGEKEILYGYLRIRSSAPSDSIILLDEPELHLNPRLIRGLPEFYRKHLGEALDNQLWLVTHSDALIREAVGKPGFNVFHMMPCVAGIVSTSQLKPLLVSEDLEVVLTDLVGDLAAYKPGEKGLIFEGGGDTDFDKTLVAALFPEEIKGINLISGSNKARVKVLHEILEKAHKKGDLPTKFYAIVDKDLEDLKDKAQAVTRFTWDVYHIENYLLVPEYVSKAINSISMEKTSTTSNVLGRLESAARHVVQTVLVHELKEFVNSKIIETISLNFSPTTVTPGKDIHASMTNSINRLLKVTNDLSIDALEAKEQELRTQIESSFSDGTWIKKLPGRDILKQFINQEKLPFKYEIFRNLLVSRMQEAGYKPPGMKSIIDTICND